MNLIAVLLTEVSSRSLRSAGCAFDEAIMSYVKKKYNLTIGDKTAEEIKASKQRSYTTVCDIQNSLKRALYELIEVLDIYVDIYDLAPRGKYSVSFNFDDSIICDRAREFSERISLVDKGIIAPWEMRAWYMNEEPEAAKQRIGEINEVQLCDTMA